MLSTRALCVMLKSAATEARSHVRALNRTQQRCRYRCLTQREVRVRQDVREAVALLCRQCVSCAARCSPACQWAVGVGGTCVCSSSRSAKWFTHCTCHGKSRCRCGRGVHGSIAGPTITRGRGANGPHFESIFRVGWGGVGCRGGAGRGGVNGGGEWWSGRDTVSSTQSLPN